MPSAIVRSPSFLVLMDVVAGVVAVLAALIVRFDQFDPRDWLFPFLPVALFPVLIRPLVGVGFNLYRREWQHASLRELFDMTRAVVVGSIAFVALFGIFRLLDLPGASPFPRSFFILEPIFFLGLTGTTRLVMRAALERRASRSLPAGVPVPSLVYGAGNAGAMIARMASSGALPDVRVVGYLDDDPRKQRSRLLGRPVLGRLVEIEDAVRRTGATQLIIAIPSGASSPVRAAVDAAHEHSLVVKTVPPFRDLVTGRYQVSGIRSVSVEDLLRREPVNLDPEAIAASINGASVVVTGGGGSIGSELVRQILTLGPRVLTVVDHHEWTLWNVERDIGARRMESDGAHVVVSLGDVRSPAALDSLIRRAKPDVVFHAAALKHVPYVERFPSEGVLTNVIGTRNVLRACERHGVGRFVLISTDKAVEPVSVMGATKRLAEHLTVAAGRRTGCAYAAVRFGNVLGSSGSIVPLLQRQLDEGMPLTITHPQATRYFMTISEAVSLILEAGADPAPGHIYVLDMGEPVKIIDLARDLVRLNGLDPEAVNFTVTGLRPGERLNEKLFYDDEMAERTRHEGIFRASRQWVDGSEQDLEPVVDRLEAAAKSLDDLAVRALLSDYQHLTGMTARAELIAQPETGSEGAAVPDGEARRGGKLRTRPAAATD